MFECASLGACGKSACLKVNLSSCFWLESGLLFCEISAWCIMLSKLTMNFSSHHPTIYNVEELRPRSLVLPKISQYAHNLNFLDFYISDHGVVPGYYRWSQTATQSNRARYYSIGSGTSSKMIIPHVLICSPWKRCLARGDLWKWIRYTAVRVLYQDLLTRQTWN